MSITRFVLFVFFVVIGLAVGCASRLGHNPLEGWKELGNASLMSCPFGEAVVNDYKSYIRSLSDIERLSIIDHNVRFYETNSLKAVEIEIPLDGIWWKHVLFYETQNARVRVTKYANSKYRS